MVSIKLRYAKYCGPAVVSKVTGLSRDMSALLLKTTAKMFTDAERVRASTNIRVVEKVLNKLGHKTEFIRGNDLPSLRDMIRETIGSNDIRIILASRHFIAVQNGEVLEDNKVLPLDSRVVCYLVISK